MASYLVLTPPDEVEKVADSVIIRDGFAYWALPVPVIWLLLHRLWFAAGLLLLGSIGLGLAMEAFPQWSFVCLIAAVLLSFYVALEGNAMRIARKERQNWSVTDIIEAPNAATAEAIFLSGFPSETKPRSKPPEITGRGWVAGRRPPARPSADSGPALGLLDPRGHQ